MKIFNFVINKPINIVNNQQRTLIRFTSSPKDCFEKSNDEVSQKRLLTEKEIEEFRDYLNSIKNNKSQRNGGFLNFSLLFKRQRFSKRIIDNLTKVVKDTDMRDLVTTLCELKDKKGEPLYSGLAILVLAETAQETDLPVFIKELAKITETEGKPKYTVKEIRKITEFVQTFDASDFFDYEDMAYYFTSVFDNKEDFSAVEYLTSSEFMCNGKPIFNFDHVINLLETAKTEEGREAIDFLTKPEFIHNGKLVFDPEDMSSLVKESQFEVWRKNVEYLYSEKFLKKLEKAADGKYKDIVMDILRKKLARIYSFYDINSFDMCEDSFLEGIHKFSTSTFKIAYDSPNQYLSGIDLEYSTPDEKGHFPKIPQDEKISEQESIVNIFKNNIERILRTLQYLDKDTVNQMMDKRTDMFKIQLKQINKLNDENFAILEKIIENCKLPTGKPLTAKDKIQLCQILYIFQQENIDTLPIFMAIEKCVIDIPYLKQIIERKVLKKAGVKQNDEEMVFYGKLNEEFGYLSLMKPYTGNTIAEKLKPFDKRTIKAINEMLYQLRNIDDYTDKQINDKYIETMLLLHNQNPDEEDNKNLFTCIREGIEGVFGSFITDIKNKYGKANLKTQKMFEKQGLNYDKWISPDIPNIDFNINGKTMRIRMWQRDPLEDLFLGNKTTCCTAIGTGGNGAAAPVFLLNTAFNVVELYDSDGKVVGMSRVFMGKIDNKPALIMDNIELNNTFIKGKDTKQRKQIRDAFFNYMNQYAQQVTGKKDAQVYFCSHNLYLSCNDLERVEKTVDFIGAISQETIYINSLDCSWINPKYLSKYGEIKLFRVPKNN